jgi:hypothetical protein
MQFEELQIAVISVRRSLDLLSGTLTVVVNRLSYPFATLMQHSLIDIHDLHSDIPVTVLFSCPVQDTQSDIPSATSDIKTLE